MNVQAWLGDQNRSDVSRWIPWLNVALGALLIWSAVKALWSFFPDQSPPLRPSTPNPVIGVSSSTEQVPLGNFHLFGQSASSELPNAPDAPETQLKLTLIGTAAGRDPKTGIAIISDDSGAQRQYQSGEIVGQATVDSIYRDRVVLLYQGRLETLKLPTLSNANRLLSSNASTSSGISGDGRTQTGVVPIGDPSNGYVNPSALPAPQASFDAVRAQVIADPAAMMGMLSPVFDSNGNLGGVKLAPSASGNPLLRSAGIVAGDVIVAVNGQRIDSVSRGQEIANNLATANEAVIIVRREGREITLPAVRFR